MDTAHVSIWLHNLIASPILEHALGLDEWDILTDWFDIPPSYGGYGLNSLSRSADEDLIESFTGIVASLIAFCRKTKMPVYIRIAHVLEALGDRVAVMEEEEPPTPPQSTRVPS